MRNKLLLSNDAQPRDQKIKRKNVFGAELFRICFSYRVEANERGAIVASLAGFRIIGQGPAFGFHEPGSFQTTWIDRCSMLSQLRQASTGSSKLNKAPKIKIDGFWQAFVAVRQAHVLLGHSKHDINFPLSAIGKTWQIKIHNWHIYDCRWPIFSRFPPVPFLSLPFLPVPCIVLVCIPLGRPPRPPPRRLFTFISHSSHTAYNISYHPFNHHLSYTKLISSWKTQHFTWGLDFFGDFFVFFWEFFLFSGLASFSLRFPLVFLHFPYLSFVFHRFSLFFIGFPLVLLQFPLFSVVFHRFSLVFLVFPL